ncbi:MAG: GNAT family N-acetyltransferase [Flavobacteriaceae bacterium]|nr:GNAT family N-acetyltransferase [Flavobacteriaceae bacterium]
MSKEFSSVWCKHFNTKQNTFTFNSLKDLSFFKSPIASLFINVGKNLTKGISYQIAEGSSCDLKGKVCFIYDVPEYAISNPIQTPNNIKIKRIQQYPGFLIHLDQHINFDDYFKKTFSKSSIQKFKRYQKRLETCFDLNEKMLMGSQVEKAEYEAVFNHFHRLLTKRFEDKQITNNNLNPKEWLFYKEVAYPLLITNKAALHVLYDGETPISVRLLYFSESIIFDAITVFDIDYTKFHLGKIAIMKMLEWSFKSPYKTFDFSKGYFDYKESWSDLKYVFEYHIWYDSKSLTASVLAHTLALLFKAKQYLRDKNIHEKLHKATFLLKQPRKNQTQVNVLPYESLEIHEPSLQKVDAVHELGFLKKHLVEFQFLNSEHQKNLSLYQIPNQHKELYLIKGKTNQQILAVSHL